MISGCSGNPNGIQIKSGVKGGLTVEFIKRRRIGIAIKSRIFVSSMLYIGYNKSEIFIFREKSRFKIERNRFEDNFFAFTF